MLHLTSSWKNGPEFSIYLFCGFKLSQNSTVVEMERTLPVGWVTFLSLPAWGLDKDPGKVLYHNVILLLYLPCLNLFCFVLFSFVSVDSRGRSLYKHLCSSITWDGRSWWLLPLQWGKDKISWRSIWWGAAEKALDRKLQDGWDFWWI